VKPFHPDELLARVRTVLRRKYSCLKNTKFLYKDISFDFESRIIKKAGQEVYMSKREKDIVEFFFLRKGELVPREELIANIWGVEDQNAVSNNNIHVTIFNIRNKLGKEFDLETKIRDGYILKEEEEV